MTVTVTTVNCAGPGLHFPQEIEFAAPSYPPFSLFEANNSDNNHAPCWWYQYILENVSEDIIIYCHDDLTIHDPEWVNRIKGVFDKKDATVVGLGGALGLGNADLYRKLYYMNNMARIGYSSNQRDAEVHGARFTGIRQVAVLDAFCMAVRRDWLVAIGGWPIRYLTHHCLDLWLACEAARQDKTTWMVGVDCTHHGGGSSVSPLYAQAKWLQGHTQEQDHQRPHHWLWDEYRDVLPIKV